MGWDAPWHWVILAVVVIALFGYKRLPDASRSLGKSLRIFKTEIKGMAGDDAVREAAKTAPVVPAEVVAAPVTAAAQPAPAAQVTPVATASAPVAPVQPVPVPVQAVPVPSANGASAAQPTTPGTV